MTPRSSEKPDRVFRALLRAFPLDFRADYGRDMEQVFRTQRHEARRTGTLRAMAALWFETMKDLVTTAPREHVAVLRQDVGYALRTLVRAPVFAAAAVLTFALGIAATTSVALIINAFLFRPLPVQRPSELVSVATADHHVGLPHGLSFRDLEDYRAQKDVFVDLLGYSVLPVAINVGGGAERVTLNTVTDNYFSLLGVTPAVGRLIANGEGRASGDAPVLVLTHEYWQTRLRGDPSIVGRAVRVNGKVLTIIGVTRPGFRGTEAIIHVAGFASLWMRDGLTNGASSLEARDRHSLTVLGRLQPDVTVDRASAAMNTLAASLGRDYPDTNKDVSMVVVPETHARPNASIATSFHNAAIGIGVLAALLLLGTTVNVANLLIARAATRGREVGLRAALGARRGRLVRQFVTESTVLALLGSVVAVPLGVLAVHALERLVSRVTPEVAIGANLDLDVRVVAATVLVATIAGVLAGLAPIVYALRTDLTGLLQSGGRSTPASLGRSSRALVVAQVAISLALLVSGGLFFRSLGHVRTVDLGFEPAGLLAASTSPNMQGYKSAGLLAYYREGERRAAAVPGVERAAWISTLPLAVVTSSLPVAAEGQPAPVEGHAPLAVTARVSADYFATARITMVDGRAFTTEDDEHGRPVAVINRTLAERFWPGQRAIGRRFAVGRDMVEVVGVVKNGRYQYVWESPQPMVFRPLTQDVPQYASLVVRAAGSPLSVATAVRQALSAADPDVPVYDIRPMTAILEDGQSFLFFRLGAFVTGLFGAMGVLLASIGLYGMVSYHVNQRTREFGVRMALGAKAADIVKHVTGRGARLAAAGLALGFLVAIALGRLLGRLLIDVSPFDPVTYLAVGGLLLAVCLLASFVPARRATAVPPLEALRAD